MKKRYVIVYDVNGLKVIYGNADNAEELKILIGNCIDDGILEFKCEYR